jgi:HNH endonuclease
MIDGMFPKQMSGNWYTSTMYGESCGRSIYNTRWWRNARDNAVYRDKWRCTKREEDGKSCKGPISVHHKVPVRAGGAPYDVDNLTTLCRRHHHEADKAWRASVFELQFPSIDLHDFIALENLAGDASLVQPFVERLIRDAIESSKKAAA